MSHNQTLRKHFTTLAYEIAKGYWRTISDLSSEVAAVVVLLAGHKALVSAQSFFPLCNPVTQALISCDDYCATADGLAMNYWFIESPNDPITHATLCQIQAGNEGFTYG